jgi:ribosomal protein S18 acetylase RimI-like enzyme
LDAGDAFDDLFALSRAFFAEYASHHKEFFELDSLSKQDVRAYFQSFIGDDERAAFVAVEGSRTIGYITVYIQEQASHWKVKRVGHISGLMVDQEYRRLGIATELLAEAKRFFAEHGVTYFAVYTAVANNSGVAFYRAQGMEPLHTSFLGKIGPAF